MKLAEELVAELDTTLIEVNYYLEQVLSFSSYVFSSLAKRDYYDTLTSLFYLFIYNDCFYFTEYRILYDT
jgi:hypothetical protein